jgi:arylsulfatase B
MMKVAMMMNVRALALVLAGLMLLLSASVVLAAAAEQPNIIILFADDLGYGELSCQGNPEIPTPHIDSIASNGVRFTDGYVAGPNCSPSRAGLLTGRTPTRFGYEFNPTGALNEEPGIGLPIEEVTIAEALHDAGYTTGLIGKWHLGGTAKYHPFRHGFDEFFGFTHEGHYFVPPPYKGVTTMLRRKTLPGGGKGRWVGKKGLIYSTHMRYDEPDYDANNPIVRGGQPVEESEYLTDALTREAVGFIDRHDDKPFFLYLAYNAVHSPLQGADAYMKN